MGPAVGIEKRSVVENRWANRMMGSSNATVTAYA